MTQPALRTCPGCQSAMQVFYASVPSARVEIDRCFFCGGLWFDGGELEQVAGRPNRLKREDAATPRSCPECATALTGAKWAQTSVDACPSCGGFYLDDAELQQLVRTPIRLEKREAAKPQLDPDLSFRCVGCGERFLFAEGLATSSGLCCSVCFARVDGSPNTVLAGAMPSRPVLHARDYTGDLAVDLLGPLLSRAARLVLDLD